MVKRRFSSLFTSLVFGVILLVASSGRAQWTLLKTFPSEINSVYFLDQQGSPKTGFVGLENSTIFRTSDNGATWNLATTPQTTVPVAITEFIFRNALQGWCSVEGYFDDNNGGAVWETTDGGLTWNSIYSIAGSVVSIGFCSASNELVAPCWNIESVCSSDFGTTWTNFAQQQQNGVTFSGSLGFVSIYNTLLNSLYSTDGGVTWNDAPTLDAEAWSPYGIPGTSTFVAVGEKTSQVFVSTNGGANWTSPFTFPPGETPIGCIMGTTAGLLVQTTNSGFYWSGDTGQSWVSICGPENYRDTRFYSVGSQVFAGDGNLEGNLWYLANATGGITLQLDKTTLVFSGTRCVSSDSELHIASSSGCTSGVLTNAQIVSGAPAFSLSGYPTNLTGNDSIAIYYTPGSAPIDSGKLLLQFDLGTRTVDTIVTLYGTARNAEANFSIEPFLVFVAPYACLTRDSALVIRNLACDSLTITGVSLSDSSHFQVLPLPLPRAIPSAGFDTIPIASFSQLDGTFTSKLELHMLVGDSEIVDSVPLTLKVLQGGHAEIAPLNLSVLDACTFIDTNVTILATPCDSIVLIQASLSDSTLFQLGAVQLPTVIPASGAVTLNLHVSPGHQGTYSTLLKLRYLSGTDIVDTTITLKLEVQYNLPVQVVLHDTLFKMGTVSVPCSSSSQWITFSDRLCRNLTIENMTWENADSAFTFDPASFPMVLSSDSGIDSVLVHFKPNAADTVSNRLRITLDLGGLVVDTFLTISGVGISSFHDTLLTPTLSYDTVLTCQSDTLEGEIVNLSCGNMIAASATLASGINYNVISPALPAILAPGDTLYVFIQLQPEQNDKVTDSARITIHDPIDGSDHIQTISLRGYVIPSSHLLTLNSTSFSLGSIAPCSFVDSAFVLTNKGNCDAVIITDTSIVGYPGVTFVPPLVLPMVIAPDSTVRVAFRVASNSDTVALTQFILNGQNIDTVITFSYASHSGGNALAFSTPDSVFTTRPCMPVTKTFWIANVGCNATSVDTITLTMPLNETQFTLDSVPGFPSLLAPGDTLYYTVQFDPNGSGDGVASLGVRAGQVHYNSSIGLTGSTVGIIPTARIALEAGDHTTQSSGFANDTTSVAAVLLDGIGDTTNLETVTFTLDANWNLLTLTNIVPAIGWSIADTVWENNGSLGLRLLHNAGGAVAAGTEFVHCYFWVAVADSTGCDISMSGLRFNDSSTNYDGCVLSSVEVQGAVRFSSIDTCGTPVLRYLLDGQVAIEIISVRPNPVPLLGGMARLELYIAVAQAGPVTITLSDMLGREVWRTTVPCLVGTQTLPLELPNIPEENCVIEVSSAGVKDSRNVVFEGGFGKN